METRVIDGQTFRRILSGGAEGIRAHVNEINELNVFPVPDGDTGTNMSKTIDSGVTRALDGNGVTLGDVAIDFAKGSLFGARGNSGVILSQFFAGICEELSDKESATVKELSTAYLRGVSRSYSAVVKPVEGTILTVFRESAEYAEDNIRENTTLEEFLRLNIEEAERSLARTKEILPALTEADVVDSGGAGYLCIARGMYASLTGETDTSFAVGGREREKAVDYDAFTADSTLELGYCTECLVRLQRAKVSIDEFDINAFTEGLEALGCDSVVALRDGDALKVHAHTHTPSDILTLCQQYGEFLDVKIENMSLQHSSLTVGADKAKPGRAHKLYGVVTVANGDGIRALFSELGADVIIDGGQTGNPSAQQFLEAFRELNADNIIVLPNNGNIVLTARQAAELWEGASVTVVPTKTVPEGYAALSVFNSSVTELSKQIADMSAAKDAVASGELTVAVRDTVTDGVRVKEGEYIGILDGSLVSSSENETEALCRMLEGIEDMEDRELITLFVGESVSDGDRAELVETVKERFPDHEVAVYIGGQKVYDYFIAVE